MSNMSNSNDEDLRILDQQEQQLRFRHFNADTAWQLGCLVRTSLLNWGASATVEIEIAGQVLFSCVTPGGTPVQADWIRRKRNTVRRFSRSSYAVGRMLEREHDTLESRHGLSHTDYAAHGGGFPILVENTGCIGSIAISGLPQRDDHNLLVEAIAKLLEKTVQRLN
jgi:uncharacterized protein (UPF0303 family)